MTDQDVRQLVSRLEGRISEIIRIMEKQADDARDNRAAVYERLNQVQTEIVQIRAEFHQVTERLGRVEPVVATVTDWKAQRNAFLWLGGGLTALVTLGTSLGNVIVSLLQNGG